MRSFIASILLFQAKRFLKKYKPRVVVISGSVGKTSTTQAIATVLSRQFAVQKTRKNYNTDVGVPCSIFGQDLPDQLKNPFSWLLIIAKNELVLLKNPSIEILVLELGADRIGELSTYAWLRPDIAVITAVAPEHMEYFKTLDNVAAEELSIAKFSKLTIYNQLEIKEEFLSYLQGSDAEPYSRSDLNKYSVAPEELSVTGEHSLDAVVAALAVGATLGMDAANLRAGALDIKPGLGRMHKLQGIKEATIIDDTYNASPVATTAALDYVYKTDAPQKIVLLGNMNELGDASAEEHTAIGSYCKKEHLDLIVTLGLDSNKYLAEAAEQNGCKVVRTDSPYAAAAAIKDVLEPNALVLIKGSQNGVFAEETVKQLLANPDDQKYLVRQSPFWMNIKKKAFHK